MKYLCKNAFFLVIWFKTRYNLMWYIFIDRKGHFMLYTVVRQANNLSFFGLVLVILSYVALVLVMLPMHEFAHAFVATKLGDQTARWHGRLTINPFAHLDRWGTVMLFLFGFGYAKPVPVNPNNFKNPNRGMSLVALAGPLSNIIMAAVSMIIYRVLTLFSLPFSVLAVAQIIFIHVFTMVNLNLAVFNLLPIPPLDGSRIFASILPARWTNTLEYYSRYVTIALLALIAFGALDYPIGLLRNFLFRILSIIIGL